jgi:predicted Na+-dependent transporter
MPFTVPLLAKGLTASAWAIAKPLLIVVLLPMAVGVAIRARMDALATRMLPSVKKGSGLAGLVWSALCLIIYGRGLLGVAGSFAVASQLVFFGVVYVGSYSLGLGLRHEQKVVLSAGVTTRKLGACMTPHLLRAGHGSARLAHDRAGPADHGDRHAAGHEVARPPCRRR